MTKRARPLTLLLSASVFTFGFTLGMTVGKTGPGAGPVSGLAAQAATSTSEAKAATAGVTSPLGLYLSGVVAQQSGDHASAALLLERALAADPDNIDLKNRTFLALFIEGREADALKLLPALRAAGLENNGSPSAPLALIVAALAEAKAGRFDAAAEIMAPVRPVGLNSLAIPLVKAWIAAGQKNAAAVEEALRPLAAMRNFEPFVALHRAMIAMVMGDMAKAAEGFDIVLKADDTPPQRVVEIAGQFFESQGQTDRARALYQTFMQRNPDNEVLLPARQRVGLVPGKATDPKRPPLPLTGAADGLAETMLDMASLLQGEQPGNPFGQAYTRMMMLLKPDSVSAQLMLADILESQKREVDAIAVYRAIPKTHAYAWGARQRIAILTDAMGDTEGALAMLDAMAKERPEREDALDRRGDILRQHERWAEAVVAYDAAIQRIKTIETRHWSVIFNRAIALERSGQIDRAVADLQQALKLQPDQPYVLNYLAYTWVERGLNLEESREMLERAVMQRPRDGAIVDSVGWYFYMVGDYPKAVQFLERAIELKPSDPTINDHLGDVYWRVGRVIEARYQWERALRLNPEPKQIEPLKQKLKDGLPPAEIKASTKP